MTPAERARHQVDHALLGACVFAAGVLFWRTHAFHHAHPHPQPVRVVGTPPRSIP